MGVGRRRPQSAVAVQPGTRVAAAVEQRHACATNSAWSCFITQLRLRSAPRFIMWLQVDRAAIHERALTPLLTGIIAGDWISGSLEVYVMAETDLV